MFSGGTEKDQRHEMEKKGLQIIFESLQIRVKNWPKQSQN